MAEHAFWNEVNTQIEASLNRAFAGKPAGGAGGGCINRTQCLEDSATGERFFVKRNRAELLSMFVTEAAGLEAVVKADAIRSPRPVCFGRVGAESFLVLEWLDLGGGGSWESMGAALANLHRNAVGNQFGWDQDNFIGTTPQVNTPSPDWANFFSQRRLAFQLSLAEARGGRFPSGDALVARVSKLLAGHHPRPSLVHGDLWSGNAAFTRAGEPVIYDVAVYWGDAEVDLAMTELFGGFPAAFYRGYHRVLPRVAGYERRRMLYNLYHILNHFNLFGGHYEHQANRMISELLS